jgi:hypothetical protein
MLRDLQSNADLQVSSHDGNGNRQNQQESIRKSTRDLMPYAPAYSQVVDGAPTLKKKEGDDSSGNRESTATANEIRTGSAGTTHYHHSVHLSYRRRQEHQEVNKITRKCTREFEKSSATMLVFITEPEAPPNGSNALSPAIDDNNGINRTQC